MGPIKCFAWMNARLHRVFIGCGKQSYYSTTQQQQRSFRFRSLYQLRKSFIYPIVVKVTVEMPIPSTTRTIDGYGNRML